MNIGIYVGYASDINKYKNITSFIDNHDKSIKDISIFYDDIGPLEKEINCGMFNSTDLWNFNGNLIVLSPSCLIKAKNIVNNIKLTYYYDSQKSKRYNLFLMLNALSITKNIVCSDLESMNYIKRISGNNDIPVTQDIYELVRLLK